MRMEAHRGGAVGLLMMFGGACVDLSRPGLAQGGPDAPLQDGGGGVGIDAPGEVSVDAPGDGITLLGQGKACQAPAECEAGFCVDGVCCNSPCAGPCAWCAVPAQEGTCVLAQDGEDPWDACPDDGATSCGRDGTCDAVGACRMYSASTACSAMACSMGELTISRCDGAGACVPAPQSCYPYGCRTSIAACRTSCTNSGDCAAPSACFVGTCGGISATYFDNPDFMGTSVTRIERYVDFDWGFGSPDPMIAPDSFSARFTGRLTPRYTEMYTFYVYSDDGVRLWIDNVLIIDDFRQHGPTEVPGTIALTAGKAVPIKLEYLDVVEIAVVRLSWYSAQQAKEVIPVTALAP